MEFQMQMWKGVVQNVLQMSVDIKVNSMAEQQLQSGTLEEWGHKQPQQLYNSFLSVVRILRYTLVFPDLVRFWLICDLIVFRVHDLSTMQQITTVEAHDSEVLCLEYTQPSTGQTL